MTALLGWFAQVQTWHDGGMFVGMHWLWWLFWVFTLFVVGWAFVRLGADRSEAHRDRLRQEAAEETLRGRFAAGEVDEEEYTRRMEILRRSRGVGGG